MSDLNDRLDRDVEGWRPEPGDKLLGRVIAVDTRASDYGDDYPYIEIETDNGEVIGVHGFHTVLKNELARVQPKPGDVLGIKYAGKVKGERTDVKGNAVEFEKYRVIHEPRTTSYESPDWDSMKAASSEVGELSSTPEEEPF